MRRVFSFLFLISAALTGTDAPAPLHKGYVRGTLVSSSADALSVRFNRSTLFRFTLDRRTWIERDDMRIAATALIPGESLEVVSDRPLNAEAAPYARLIRVFVSRPAQQEIVSGGNYSFRRVDRNLLTAEANLTFSGLVTEREGSRIRLQTRIDGIKTIYLRPDTSFLYQGSRVSSNELPANVHIFVRAVRNLDNELEAFEVVWGGILAP